MRDGTSGMMFSRSKDGSICIQVVDYGVEEFDGRDWECWYDLDKENADRLNTELKKEHSGTLEKMLQEAFCKRNDFLLYEFECFCREHNIVYERQTWV
jgi:hypothetical protein